MSQGIEIPVQTQWNSDGSLAYVKYKYKGSTVKFTPGYDAQGNLVRLNLPQFLNLSHTDMAKVILGQFVQSMRKAQVTVSNTLTLPTSTVFNSFNQALGAGLSAVMWTPPAGKSSQILHFHLGVTWNNSPADYVQVADGDGTVIGLFFPQWYNPVTDVYGGDYDVHLPGSGLTTVSKATSVEVLNGSGVTAIVVIGTIDGNEV